MNLLNTYAFSRRNLCHLAPALLLLALQLTLGCRSVSGPGSASFASVTIEDHSTEEIAGAASRVFAEDGYQARPSASSGLIFEKEASRATTMSRDGLVAAQGGARTINRVRVEIVPLGEATHRLQCRAFMVTGAGDSFFEEEIPLAHARRRPYQSLLNQVEKSLR